MPEPPADSLAARGRLKVFLGATPGAGKTFAMLREAQRLRRQARDVVVGYVETYGRPHTVEALGDLEVVPRRILHYRGSEQQEMNLPGVIARHPEVALVDELAHTNAPGVEHSKRWQDVDDLLDAGIDVITTMNVQHLDSAKDLVEKVCGIIVRETVPDRVLDRADEIQFIDITPEALRKRMRHGNIYPKERIETALSNFFRPANLTALRLIGLRVVADTMGRTHRVLDSPEDVVVAVSCGPGSEDLIRRGARLARRVGGVCLVVNVTVYDQAPEASKLRDLAVQLGCSFSQLGAPDVASGIIEAARAIGAEHIVIGEVARRTGLARFRPSLVEKVIANAPDSDIHVIARRAG